MRETITISLPANLRKQLDRVVKSEHLNRSDVVREALKKFLAVREFRRLRGLLVPEAEKKGYFGDDDIFEQVS